MIFSGCGVSLRAMQIRQLIQKFVNYCQYIFPPNIYASYISFRDLDKIEIRNIIVINII